MTTTKHVGDLDILQDLRHERLEWKLERIGWVVMALVLGAALAGLLGPGPLSRAIAGETGGPLRVEYNRIVRYQAPESLRVRIPPGPGATVRLWLPAAFVHDIELDHIDPEPESVAVGPERLTYTFKVEGDRPSTVVFYYQARAFGRMSGAVGLDGADRVAFGQFALP